ncbi:MAG: penicillin-binding protein 2 [Phycisphaerales bacterium]
MNQFSISQISEKQSSRIRAWSRVLIVTTATALLCITARVAWLKTTDDPRLMAAAGVHQSTAPELASRGQIVDRRGRVLASSLMGRRLFADPAMIWDRGWDRIRKGKLAEPDSLAVGDPFKDAASAIGGALGEPSKKIQTILNKRADDRYVQLADMLTPEQVDAIHALNIPGIGIESRPIREYPAGDLAAMVIGRVGLEQSGQAGAELRHNAEVRGKDGQLVFLRDVKRQPLWIEGNDYQPPRDGVDIRLSIDLVAQEIAERLLQEGVKEWNAGGGRAVIMDVQTGDILAMADVLHPRKGWKEVTTDPSRALHASLGRNRNVTDPYEPGSTFKPFVWATATELGVFKPETIVNLPNGPYVTKFGRVIRDVKYPGPVTWKKVLVKSLNGGMAAAAERMKFSDMQNMVQRFGFGQKSGVGIPGESEGLVTTPKKWSVYTQTSVCMGHEIGVTPIQMVQAFSAFCRDGSMVPARLSLGTEGADNQYSVPSKRVMPEAIALTARDAMEGVMTEGTGRKAQSEFYRMFGKSGTAQLPKPKGQGKGYFEDRYVSSFIAGAPFDNPRIVCLVVLDDPDKSKGHYGGSIAGPVCRKMIDATLNYMGVEPDQSEKQGKLAVHERGEPDRH